jgi:hypothetical protein
LVEHSFTGSAGVTSANEQEDVFDHTTGQRDGDDHQSNDDEYHTQQSVMLDLVNQMGHSIVSNQSASINTPSKFSRRHFPSVHAILVQGKLCHEI